MSKKTRPIACSTSPVVPVPLGDDDAARLVSVFKALGDPTRLEIFRLIAAQDAPLCVCDIVGRFAVSQPTISHHLKVLREAGLVTVSRRGVWAYYAADPRGMDGLRDLIGEVARASLSAAAD
jgi:ArsR family transcriptional regulator